MNPPGLTILRDSQILRGLEVTGTSPRALSPGQHVRTEHLDFSAPQDIAYVERIVEGVEHVNAGRYRVTFTDGSYAWSETRRVSSWLSVVEP